MPRRRPRMIGSLMVALLLSSAVADAQDTAPKFEPAAREHAVISCVLQVRQKNPQSRFDAHVSLRGDITTSGKENEQAEFRQCLQGLGQPLKAADSAKS